MQKLEQYLHFRLKFHHVQERQLQLQNHHYSCRHRNQTYLQQLDQLELNPFG